MNAVHGCDTLLASLSLIGEVETAGTAQAYSSEAPLFTLGETSRGVFLVRYGNVKMGIDGLPEFDRVFGSGALLGLPSTITGDDYSLTARAADGCEAVFVPRERFLQLLQDRPDLCRETTEMLSREMSFIQKALAQKRRHPRSA
jgi:CRP-like cAMP-binding protein